MALPEEAGGRRTLAILEIDIGAAGRAGGGAAGDGRGGPTGSVRF